MRLVERPHGIAWNERSLWLSPLDLQLAVNEKRGRAERAEAIRHFAAAGES